ncbi:MAG: hypothetical protein VX798_10130 [Bacteroidota bacterium]|nr:hypothetical protein [Bacteroidota bacterium]
MDNLYNLMVRFKSIPRFDTYYLDSLTLYVFVPLTLALPVTIDPFFIALVIENMTKT